MPGIQNNAVEDLTITFRKSGRYNGHHSDRGYNAIQLVNVSNCWVRNVGIENADNGIFVTESEFVTVSGVVVDSVDRTIDDGKNLNGHHALTATFDGQSVLYQK
ncbi:hypothetical protein CHLNCDRAFT_133527 [Chlorella variabilis]|uniref:Pectate lyase n=1 Tax=Chlorella variabilis TaxID=554065 RepID=E1Z3A1_CHLVA|nr:hypothetical protein CHLNCDRAFT_133527 [Chlorella variabilis]EFN60135.1 hypothetical protein CHLNCDRAFT_133527 [Chlorella variabilis]|eukprot:XP_005852237.1 hypothetical protein CHLNCDRAFT_133527 [Chlorella variabilis]